MIAASCPNKYIFKLTKEEQAVQHTPLCACVTERIDVRRKTSLSRLHTETPTEKLKRPHWPRLGWDVGWDVARFSNEMSVRRKTLEKLKKNNLISCFKT